MRKVGLLDYGSGNLHSAARALTTAGAQVTLASRRSDLWSQEALVVPGVGAYAACMAGLIATGGDDLICDWVQTGRPLLGICVGHQILFEAGDEHGHHTPGLGIHPGIVQRLAVARLPHMGWNTVVATHGSVLFSGIAQERFYFVHSYAALTDAPGVSHSAHGQVRFVAAVEHNNVFSTQFHPEKSGPAGLALLQNWLTLI